MNMTWSLHSRGFLCSGEDEHVNSKALGNELSTQESHPGSGRHSGSCQIAHLHFQTVCNRTPAYIQTAPGKLGETGRGRTAGSPVGSQHLGSPAARATSERCQRRAPPGSSAELLPEGGEREGGALNRGSRGSSIWEILRLSRRRHLDTKTRVQDGTWVLSNGTVLTVLAAWVLVCKAKLELREKRAIGLMSGICHEQDRARNTDVGCVSALNQGMQGAGFPGRVVWAASKLGWCHNRGDLKNTGSINRIASFKVRNDYTSQWPKLLQCKR